LVYNGSPVSEELIEAAVGTSSMVLSGVALSLSDLITGARAGTVAAAGSPAGLTGTVSAGLGVAGGCGAAAPHRSFAVAFILGCDCSTGFGVGAGVGATGAGVGSGDGGVTGCTGVIGVIGVAGCGVGSTGAGAATGCTGGAGGAGAAATGGCAGCVPLVLRTSSTATYADSSRFIAGKVLLPELSCFIASSSADIYSRPTTLSISTRLTGFPTFWLTSDLISRIRIKASSDSGFTDWLAAGVGFASTLAGGVGAAGTSGIVAGASGSASGGCGAGCSGAAGATTGSGALATGSAAAGVGAGAAGAGGSTGAALG